MGISSSIKTPHAAVIIWNYEKRLGNYNASDVHKIEEIIVNTKTLIGISTSKRKAAPAGEFEFRLAPNINWVSKITPGSWCAILMSQNTQIGIKSNDAGLGVADSRTMKMLGRIDSVRVAVDVDQETGTRRTMYIVTGMDWGSVFDTKLYIDPINTNNILKDSASVGNAMLLTVDNVIKTYADKLPTTTETVAALLRIWGVPVSGFVSSIESAINGTDEKGDTGTNQPIQLTSDSQYLLPSEVATYMGFTDAFGLVINHMHEILNFRTGKLRDIDQYEETNEAFGFIDTHSLHSMHTLWQLLTDNCNTTLNELVTDMTFASDGSCVLQLLKRIKPFLNRQSFPGSNSPQVSQNASYFFNVKTEEVALQDVLNINAGTNWRDRVNFIEVSPQPILSQFNYDAATKINQQVVYKAAYEREGFRPLREWSKHMPYAADGTPDIFSFTEWKYLLAEWYFNTDLMLNGSVTILGQDQYISVGDNIRIDSTVLGDGSFNDAQANRKTKNTATYLIAHVESVSHSFSVNPETGSRSFFTTINFVRGIITDKSGQIVVSPSTLGSIAQSAASNLLGKISSNLGSLTSSQQALATALNKDLSGMPSNTLKNTNVIVSDASPVTKIFDNVDKNK